MTNQARPGPGTLRVGRFIGRLGVVSIPAVEVGLDLDQRVVRRHVAKLEAAGWLAREPWIWGEGSVVWLTGAGIEGAGLGGVRPVKSPPGATTIAHGVLVGWSAARVEHGGRAWKSARELAVEREMWAISARCERGYTGILSGRYTAVHYHCASTSVAHWINCLAKKVGLTGRTFRAEVQMNAEEIAALLPAAIEPDELRRHQQLPSHDSAPERDEILTARATLPPARAREAARTSTGAANRNPRGRRRARTGLPRDLRTRRAPAPPAMATLIFWSTTAAAACG